MIVKSIVHTYFSVQRLNMGVFLATLFLLSIPAFYEGLAIGHSHQHKFRPTKSGFVEEPEFGIWSDHISRSQAIYARPDELLYIGCYDAWEGNRLIYKTRRFDNENTVERCQALCHSFNTTFILLKGKFCSCVPWGSFRNTRVAESYCTATCPGNHAQDCGGNQQFSVHCDRSQAGDCVGFVTPPISDLYAVDAEATSLSKISILEEARFVGGAMIEPMYPCVNCTSSIAECVQGGLNPHYDYLPENSARNCVEFCGRPVRYFKNTTPGFELEEVRQPTKYAMTGWKMEGNADYSICKCTDNFFDDFGEIERGNCSKTCPDTNDTCGGSQAWILTVYCREPRGCEGTTYPTTIHTIPSSLAPSSPTTPEPNSDTTSITTRPTTTTRSTSTSTTTTTTTTPTTGNPINCSLRCTGQDSFGERWSSCPNRTATKPCKNEQTRTSLTRFARWFCQPSGIFEGRHPDMSECQSDWVESIEEELSGSDPVPPENAATLLQRIEHEMRLNSYYGHEISKILGYVDTIFTRLETVETNKLEILTGKSMDIGNEVLIKVEPWLQLSPTKNAETVTTLFNVIEDNLFEMAKSMVQNTSVGNAEPKSWLRSSFMVGTGGGAKSDLSDRLEYPFRHHPGSNGIRLPGDWQTAVKGELVYFQGLTMPRKSIQNLLPNIQGFEANRTSNSFKVINSGLIGFSLGSCDVKAAAGNHTHFAGEGVVVVLHHEVEGWGDRPKTLRRKLHHKEKVKVALGTAKCVFWDVTNLKWSTDGCRVIKSDRFITKCECSHLTNFAVLFDTHSYVSKQLGLELLTIILCSLSVICLFTTIIIFTILRSTHSSRTTITKNLAGCLLIGNSLVLLVMDRHYFDMSEGVCTASAIIIHYIFLSAFMWMGIEGYYLYKLMIHVFDSGSTHLTIYRILGYGVPLVIVAITGSVGFFKGEDPYGGDMFCWLQGKYMWSFLVPVAIVVLGNSIILLITLKTAYQVKTSKAQVQARTPINYRTWAKGCLSLSVLLGLTWTIGFLITLDTYTGSVVFAYLFTVLNGTQGVVLFMFHCLFNEKVTAAAARRNINLPSWLSGSISGSKGPNESPSHQGTKTKTNLKTVFDQRQQQMQVKGTRKPVEVMNENVVESLRHQKHEHEAIPKARRRSSTSAKDIRNFRSRATIHVSDAAGSISDSSTSESRDPTPSDENYGGTISSIDSFRTLTTDCANYTSGNESSISTSGSQKHLIKHEKRRGE